MQVCVCVCAHVRMCVCVSVYDGVWVFGFITCKNKLWSVHYILITNDFLMPIFY